MKKTVVTIQQTAKRFKLASFTGAMGFCITFPMVITAPATAGEVTGLIASMMLVLYGRVGKWWHHE